MLICAAAGNANAAAARPRTATAALVFIKKSFRVVETSAPSRASARLAKGAFPKPFRAETRPAGQPHVAELQRKALAAHQVLKRRADRFGKRRIGRDISHSGARLLLVVAERNQRLHELRSAAALGRRRYFADAAFELEQQPLGGLVADARYLGEAPGILQRDALRELADRHAGEHREGGARADAGNADQLAEGAALFAGGEAIEIVRVLAHHEMREEAYRLAVGRQRVEGAHRHVDLVGDAADIDQHLRRVLRREPPGKAADQTSLPL